MPTRSLVLSSLLGLSLLSCVGEDIVDDFVSPELRLENPLQSLGLNESHQFDAKYLNSIGGFFDYSILGIGGAVALTALGHPGPKSEHRHRLQICAIGGS